MRRWPWFATLATAVEEPMATLPLENAGYECFPPIAAARFLRPGPLQEAEVPFFSGYLFCRIDANDRLPVLKTPGVIQIVGVGEKSIPAKEAEIAALQQVVKSRVPTVPWPFLQLGDCGKA
jgi:transcription termination/antitermination protein NusG